MCFLAMDAMCEASMYCKKISDTMLDDGASIASTSFWIIMLPLLVK